MPGQRLVPHVLPCLLTLPTAHFHSMARLPCRGVGGRRNGAVARGGRDCHRRGHHLGRVMRHFPIPVAGLPPRVRVRTVAACLVLAPCRSQCAPPRARTAGPPTVPLTAVAAGAQEEELTAHRPGAGYEAKRVGHRTRRTSAFLRRAAARATSRSPRAHSHTDAPASERSPRFELGGLSSSRGRAAARHNSPQPLHKFSVSPGPPRRPGPSSLLDTPAVPSRGDYGLVIAIIDSIRSIFTRISVLDHIWVT